jgi:hypothetical protein
MANEDKCILKKRKQVPLLDKTCFSRENQALPVAFGNDSRSFENPPPGMSLELRRHVYLLVIHLKTHR